VWLEGLGQLKNPMTIGNRTRDLLTCIIVPQLRAPIKKKVLNVYRFFSKLDPYNSGMVNSQILESEKTSSGY
jgi:hypothetical protein